MNKGNNVIIVLLIVMIIAILGVGGYYIYDSNSKSETRIKELENKIAEIGNSVNRNENGNVVENSTSQSKNESTSTVNTPKDPDIYDVEISDQEKILLMYRSKNFNNVNELSTEDLLNFASFALNRNSVKGLKSNDISSSEYGQAFTVADIKSIIYELFGIELKNNMSTEDIKFMNGVYYFMFADGGVRPVYSIENEKNEYTIFGSGNIEELRDVEMGTYKIEMDKTTGTIKSSQKIKDGNY